MGSASVKVSVRGCKFGCRRVGIDEEGTEMEMAGVGGER